MGGSCIELLHGLHMHGERQMTHPGKVFVVSNVAAFLPLGLASASVRCISL